MLSVSIEIKPLILFIINLYLKIIYALRCGKHDAGRPRVRSTVKAKYIISCFIPEANKIKYFVKYCCNFHVFIKLYIRQIQEITL